MLPKCLSSKESSCNAGDTKDMGLISGSRRFPGGGHGNAHQYSCLENPMERGAWWAMLHGVAKSQTQLKWMSIYTHTHTLTRVSHIFSIYNPLVGLTVSSPTLFLYTVPGKPLGVLGLWFYESLWLILPPFNLPADQGKNVSFWVTDCTFSIY